MIIGVDPSLTSTGVVILSDTGEFLGAAQIPSSNALRMDVRCQKIAEGVCSTAWGVRDCTPWRFYIEEPGGQLKGAAQDCRTLFWFIVQAAMKLNADGPRVPHVDIYATAPASLKKYMTGRGNATPADKCAAVMTRWMHLLPEKYQVNADAKGGIAKFKDLFDGMGLAQMGLTHLTGEGTSWQKEAAGKLKIIATGEESAA